jgi:hypothetical protein
MAIDWNKAMSSGKTKKKKSDIDWDKAGAYTDEELRLSSSKSTVLPQEWAESKKTKTSIPSKATTKPTQTEALNKLGYVNNKTAQKLPVLQNLPSLKQEEEPKVMPKVLSSEGRAEWEKQNKPTTYQKVAKGYVSNINKTKKQIDENIVNDVAISKNYTDDELVEIRWKKVEKEYNKLDDNAYALLDAVADVQDYEDRSTLSAFTQMINRGSVGSTVAAGSDALETAKAKERANEAEKALEKQGFSKDEIKYLAEYRRQHRNAQQSAEMSKIIQEETEAHPVLASGLSVASNLASPLGMIETARAKAKGVPIDPNANMFAPAQMTSDIREEVQSNYDWNVDINKDGKSWDAFDFVYGAGMSTADSLVAGAVTPSLGITTSSANWLVKSLTRTANHLLGGSVIGAQAMTSTIQDVTRRGGTTEQAINSGVVAFLAETLSEAWSIGNFKGLQESGKRGLANLAKDLLKSSGVNASEEMITEAVNLVYDRYALGDKSNFELNVQAYMQTQKPDGTYYTREEAESLAWQDNLKQIGEAGLSGAFQGLLMGGTANVAGRVSQNAKDAALGKDIKQQGLTGAVVEAARTSQDELVQEYIQKINRKGTDKASNADVGSVTRELLKGGETTESALETIESYSRPVNLTSTEKVQIAHPTLGKADGKVISLSSVESVNNGNITVKNSNGETQTLDLNSLEGKAKELWTYASEHFTDAKAIESFVQNYNGRDIDTYSRVYKGVFDLASVGMTAEQIKSEDFFYSRALGEKAFNSAVESGNTAMNYKQGVVDLTTQKKTHSQKLIMNMANEFGKRHGMNITFVDTLGSKEGFYKPNSNQIVIALDSSRGAIARTLGHETYHYVEQQSGVQAGQISDFVIDSLTNIKGKEWVESRYAFYEKQGYKTLAKQKSELVADQMFEVFANERAVNEFVAKDRTFAQKVLDHIKGLIAEIKNIYKKLVASGNYEDIAAWQEDLDALQKVNDMMLDALSNIEQRKNTTPQEQQFVEAFGEELGDIETNEDGEVTLITNEDESVIVSSHVTWDNGGKADLEKALKRNGYNASEVEDIVNSVEEIADFLEGMAKDYADNKNYKVLQEHLMADITMDVKNGKAVLRSIVNNGDYPVNIDLALNCKKRVAYMRVMRDLINNGVFESVKYDGDAIAKVNEILRKNGFETACLGCFVESRRLQFQAWAETIVQEWNNAVDKYDKNAKYFGYAKVQKGASALTEEEIVKVDQELSSANKNEQGNVKLGSGAVASKMKKLLKLSPTLRQKITVADLLTPEGLTNLRRENPNLFSLVKSRYGAASPKIVQNYNPYSGEMANLTFAKVKDITHNSIKGSSDYIADAEKTLGASKPEQPKKMNVAEYKQTQAYKDWESKVQTLAMRNYLYDIGGARMQSFSDFMIENVFDYVQIVADLAANKFPMHTYTKEITMMRLFGMTGIKMNGSLICHTEKTFDSKYAGLLPASEASKGNAILVETDEGEFAIGFDDYARYSASKGTSDESFIQSIGFKDMIALQLDPRYSPYCGNIAIGVSDLHIKAMLDSDLFRMVIPYHSSGMLPQFAKLVGVDKYNDYTNYQNTTVLQCYDVNGKKVGRFKKGDKDLAIDTSYPFNAELKKVGEPKVAAKNYIDWCAEMHPVYDGKTFVGYATFAPKFSNSPYGTDFSKHENYYKLLEDFDVYDSVTGEYAEQGAVKMTYPSAENRMSLEEVERYRKALERTGVFSAKEIDKYVNKANMTFEEIIKAELDNRSLYESTQSKKYDATIQEIADTLVQEHSRSGQISSYTEFANTLKKGTSKQKNEMKGKFPLKGTYDVPSSVRFSTKRDADYMTAVENGDMETAQRMVDEAAREAGYNPEHLFHGTSAFGFTEIDTKNSDDGFSFFVTNKEEVAQGYFPYYENEYDDYHDAVRTIGKKTDRPRPPLSPSASVESVIDSIKAAYPEYKNARRATEADILADLGDYWLPNAVSSAKELQSYSIQSNVRELVDLVVDASEDGTYGAWKAVADRYTEFEDIYDIVYNGQYWYQATALWHKIQMGIQMASKIMGEEAIFNNGDVVSKTVLVNKYNDYLAGEANGIYDLYANHSNQLVIEGRGSNWNNIPLGSIASQFNEWWVKEKGHEPSDNGGYTRGNTRTIAEFAKAKGYRSVCFVDIYDAGAYGNRGDLSTVYAFFYPSQDIKSADPVTYDNNGNVIPLSQRFDEGNEDIRFATKRESSISEEASDYILDTKEYQDILKIVDQRYNLTNKKNLSPKAVERLAGKLLSNSKSKYDKGALTERLSAFFDYMANSNELVWEDVMKTAAEISHDILSQSSILDRSMQNQYKDTLDYLKGLTVYISPEVRAEIDSRYGSLENYRRMLGGKTKITVTDSSKMSLDSLWKELNEYHPEMFDADVSSLDQAEELMNFFDMTKPTYVNQFEYYWDMNEASYDFALQIYEEYFNIPEVVTESQRHKLEMERLKGKQNAKTAQIRKEYKDRIKRIRAEKNSKIEATKELYRERNRQYREKRNDTAERQKLRRQIVRETKKLTDKLVNPTDQKHIPQELIVGINSFARAMTEHGAFPAQRAATLQRAFKNIGEKATDPDFNIASMYDEGIEAMLDNLASVLSNKRLGEMTSAELTQVRDIARYFSHIVSMSNQAFSDGIKEKLSELQTSTFDEVASQSKDKKRMMYKMQTGLLKPVTFFEILESPTLEKLYTNIRKGEEKWARTVLNAKQKRIDAQEKHGYKKWADDKVDITTERGDKLSISVKEALSIYATSKRAQSVDHIMKGGIVLEEEARKQLEKKNRFKKNKDKSVNVRSANIPLSLADIQNINSSLTDEQKAYADELVRYMSSDMAKLGNEVSMKLYGIQKYNEDYYFPLKSASNFLYSEPGVENDSRIKHMSMTKRTVPKANNPVVIGDFTETAMSHCNDMALYYGFTLPLEDFKRVWNYKTPTIEGTTPSSIKQQIDMVYGDKANKYIKQMLTDINGGVTKQAGADVVNKMISLIKKNSVFASLSVAVQQPSAIARSLAYIDPKYFVGVQKKGTWEEIKKYAPVAVIKEMGYFDTGIGRQAVDWMTETEYEGLIKKAFALFIDRNYRDDVLSFLPSYMDEISWGRIWVAVKNETKAKYPDLDVKSEEFLNKVGERFTYVIDRTQVYDSVFSRSEWMRSKDTGVKVATAFMSEPLTNYNLLYNAAIKAKNGDKKFAARALSAYVVSIVFNSILKSFVTSARDDDKEKSYWEKYIANVISNITGEPFGMIPYFNDVISLIQGYGSDRMDTQILADSVDALSTIFNSEKSIQEKVKVFVNTLGLAIGVPFKNFNREAVALYNGAQRILKGDYESTTGKGIKYAVAEKYDSSKFKIYKSPNLGTQVVEAYLEGDTAHYNKQYNNMLEKYGGDESEVASQIRSALKEQYTDGKISYDEAKSVLINLCGESSSDAYWKLDEWDTPLEEGETYSKYDDFYDAVSQGNVSSVARIYKQQGVSKETLSGRITSEFKEEYVMLYKTNPAKAETLKQKLLNAYVAIGYDREEKSKDIDRWVK